MPFYSQAYLESLDKARYSKILTTHVPFGYHHELGDRLLALISDLYSGTYILGVQGSGKTCLLENLILHAVLLNRASLSLMLMAI